MRGSILIMKYYHMTHQLHVRIKISQCNVSFLPPANKVWNKVMEQIQRVCLQRGRGLPRGGGLHPRGLPLGGLYLGGRGLHPGTEVCIEGGVRQTPPQNIKVGGTDPTEMLSCLDKKNSPLASSEMFPNKFKTHSRPPLRQ